MGQRTYNGVRLGLAFELCDPNQKSASVVEMQIEFCFQLRALARVRARVQGLRFLFGKEELFLVFTKTF
jgi:hypothetical protein